MRPEKKESYKETSRELFGKLGKTCIQTTAVGSLAAIEEKLGHLWGHDGSEMDEEKLKNKDLFAEVRKLIFDLNHKQIELFKRELENYDIVWNRYVLNMKVVQPENKKDQEGN